MKTTVKTYDAVGSVRTERTKYAEAIKGMTPAEIIAYTRKLAKESGVRIGKKR